LVSKQFKHLREDQPKTPLNVTIRFLRPSGNTIYGRSIYLSPDSERLLEDIHAPGSLTAKSIRSVELFGDNSNVRSSDSNPVDPVSILRNLFKVLHRHVHYRLSSPPDLNLLDVALSNQQLEVTDILARRVVKPRASLKASSSEFIYLHLLTAYSSFEITSDELGKDVDFLRDVLAHSLKRLESLNIPLTIATAPLDKCISLHRLKLRFVEAHYHKDLRTWTRQSGGLGPAMNLVEMLSYPSIRRLILAGFPVEEELTYLFNNENPAFVLPDSVLSFSLEFLVRPRYLLHFVKNLSPQSELEEMNVVKIEGFEDSLMEEFEKECRRKKISLTFNRIWEL